MTIESELKEIRILLSELNVKFELIEERLIGCEQPTKEDIAATEEYEAAKKNKTLQFTPLDSLKDFLKKEPDLYSKKGIKTKAKGN